MVDLRVAGVKRNTSISTQISVDHRPLARCSLAAREGPLVPFTGKRGESKVCKPWHGGTSEDHHKPQTSQSYRGGRQEKKEDQLERVQKAVALHPTSAILNVCSTLSYNPLVGFLTENGQ